MAKTKAKGKNAFNLNDDDFNNNRKTAPGGTYHVKITPKTVIKKARSGAHDNLEIQAMITKGPHKGVVFFDSIAPHVGWKIAQLVSALGLKMRSGTLEQLLKKVVNQDLRAILREEEYQGQTKNKVVQWLSKDGAVTAGAVDDDDDDDLDDDDLDDEDEDEDEDEDDLDDEDEDEDEDEDDLDDEDEDEDEDEEDDDDEEDEDEEDDEEDEDEDDDDDEDEDEDEDDDDDDEEDDEDEEDVTPPPAARRSRRTRKSAVKEEPAKKSRKAKKEEAPAKKSKKSRRRK